MIVITGATGQFGRLVLKHLLNRGVPAGEIVAAIRNPDKASEFTAQGIEVRIADYDRPDTLLTAFEGADKILLVSSTGPDDARITQHRAAIDAAVASGVGLLAYTSVTNAPTSPMGLARVHRATEHIIADAGLPAVVLRNGWYTENHTASLTDAIARGSLIGSAGDGQVAFAAREDLAEAAAIVLTRDDQAGMTYELTGDTVWTLSELAAEAAAQSGTSLIYTDLPAEQYQQILTQVGLPDHIVDLIIDADVGISQGSLSTITSDLPTILGRTTTAPSTTVAQALRT